MTHEVPSLQLDFMRIKRRGIVAVPTLETLSPDRNRCDDRGTRQRVQRSNYPRHAPGQIPQPHDRRSITSPTTGKVLQDAQTGESRARASGSDPNFLSRRLATAAAKPAHTR